MPCKRTIETILSGVQFTMVRVDNILVYAVDDLDPLQKVEGVLQQLKQA